MTGAKDQGLDRRELIAAGLTGALIVPAVAAASAAEAAPPATTPPAAPGRPQPFPTFTPDMTTSDILVETLIAWGVTHIFGIVGDGINPLIEALRKRQDRIAFITVRHEESAAFMATAFAKHSGRLGACIATTGPGAVHLMNGLYDAKLDNTPVIAITGSTFHDLEGMHFVQSVETTDLMTDVALFNERVNSAGHAALVVNRACRAALAGRGVAHLTVAKDTQAATLGADKPSMENHGGRSSSSWSPPAGAPPADQIRMAADLINAGTKVAILAGSGCFGAIPELRRLADLLGAPIAKAYLAKALLPDADPLTTGGIGHLGTQPSMWTMAECDTVLILGSNMPWIDYYPKPGQARGVQIDIKPEQIGIKIPVEVGLAGDMKATLAALLPMLKRKDRGFLTEAQRRMAEWSALLDRVATTQKGPRIRPQTVTRMLSDLAPDNAIFSMDAGANTHFAARMIQIRGEQRWSGTGTLDSMASALPYAVAASFAFPDRPSIAVAGDGGLAMLMAELSTAVMHRRNVKVLVLNNDSFGEVPVRAARAWLSYLRGGTRAHRLRRSVGSRRCAWLPRGDARRAGVDHAGVARGSWRGRAGRAGRSRRGSNDAGQAAGLIISLSRPSVRLSLRGGSQCALGALTRHRSA